jgi:hypothetical protein
MLLLSGRDPVIERRLLGRRRVGTRLQFREALADNHFIVHRLFPEVFLHLHVYVAGDFSLAHAQRSSRVVLRQVAPEMLHGLPREVVEQVGVIVVGHVVEINQTADDVIFRPRLFAAFIPES